MGEAPSAALKEAPEQDEMAAEQACRRASISQIMASCWLSSIETRIWPTPTDSPMVQGAAGRPREAEHGRGAANEGGTQEQSLWSRVVWYDDFDRPSTPRKDERCSHVRTRSHHVRPKHYGGRACIRGTRVTVSLIVNLVANGMDAGEVIEAYPYVEAEDIRQALQYAASARSS